MPAECRRASYKISDKLVLIERLWRLHLSGIVILRTVASLELTLVIPSPYHSIDTTLRKPPRALLHGADGSRHRTMRMHDPSGRWY
jgi:hypothetical protein